LEHATVNKRAKFREHSVGQERHDNICSRRAEQISVDAMYEWKHDRVGSGTG